MTPPHQGGFDGLKLLTHPFFDRSPFDDEPLIPVALATNMHKPQELKGLWLPLSSLLPVLQERAGRVVWNGWPTGVAVSWAMQHGGPFPATVGSVHTSVGVTAARRFQRPVCFQDIPQQYLPKVLRDQNKAGISRRIDGRPTLDDVSAQEESA